MPLSEREAAKQAKRLTKLANKWVDLIGLKQWEISFSISDETLTLGHGSDESEQAAVCWSLWQYLEAGITFSGPFLLQADDDELEAVFLHELMHLHLSELRPPEDDDDDHVRHEERVTTLLSRAVRDVYRHGYDAGLKKGAQCQTTQ